MIVVPYLNGKRYFLGDNRGFSSEYIASARIHARVDITNLDGDTLIISSVDIHCGESHEIDPDTGEVIARATATTEDCRFYDPQTGKTTAPKSGILSGATSGVLELGFEATASILLLPIAPNIKMKGILGINRGAKRITFTGNMGEFLLLRPMSLSKEMHRQSYSNSNLCPPLV